MATQHKYNVGDEITVKIAAVTENDGKTSYRIKGIENIVMTEAVLKKLAIGQQYRLKSINATSKDYPVSVICTLMDLNRNVVVFKHKNGTLESFTYQEIWTQMMCGDFI